MFHISFFSLGDGTSHLLTTEIFLDSSNSGSFQIVKDDGSLPFIKQLIGAFPLLFILLCFILINLQINDRILLLQNKLFSKTNKDEKINNLLDHKTKNVKELNFENKISSESASLIEKDNVSESGSIKSNKKEKLPSKLSKYISDYFDKYQQLIIAILCSSLFGFLSIQLQSFNILRFIIPISASLLLFTFLTILCHRILRHNSFSSLWLLVGYLKFDHRDLNPDHKFLSEEEEFIIRKADYCFTHYIATIVLLSVPLFYSVYNTKDLYSITKVNLKDSNIVNNTSTSNVATNGPGLTAVTNTGTNNT